MNVLNDSPPKGPELPTVTEDEVQGFDLGNTGTLLNLDTGLVIILVQMVDFEICGIRFGVFVVGSNTLEGRSLVDCANDRGSVHGWSGHGDSVAQADFS